MFGKEREEEGRREAGEGREEVAEEAYFVA